MCWSRLQRWRTGVYGCGGVRHDLSPPVSVQACEMCNVGEWWWTINDPRPVADTVMLSPGPGYDVVRERAVSPTVLKFAASLLRHRFRVLPAEWHNISHNTKKTPPQAPPTYQARHNRLCQSRRQHYGPPPKCRGGRVLPSRPEA